MAGNTVSYLPASKKPTHPDGPVPTLSPPELCCFSCCHSAPFTGIYVPKFSMYSWAGSLSLQKTASNWQFTARLWAEHGNRERKAIHGPWPQGVHSTRLGREADRSTIIPRGRQKVEWKKEAMHTSVCLQFGIWDGHRQILLFSLICQGHHWSREQALPTTCLPLTYQMYLYRS